MNKQLIVKFRKDMINKSFTDNTELQFASLGEVLKTKNGNIDEVKSALGEPVKATDSRLRFATKSGYTVNFDFVSDEWSPGKRRLQCIKISCPDSGEFVRSRFDRGGPTR